jgi:hypothetical protein
VQSFLQIDVAETVLHKADQPNTFFDFFDPQGLPREDRAEINFFAVQTDASAVGDVNDAVVKRISKFWQAAIAADGGSVDFRGALHVCSLRQALDHGLPIQWGLGMDSFPDLTSLHGDLRFIAMVAEVKQRAAATKTPE